MKLISYLFLVLSLASGISKNKTTKAFNKEEIYFGDATTKQIEEYYGDFSKYAKEDLIDYLYSIISKDNNFVTYSSISNWYKITDRNYSISNPIDPSSYDFSQDNGTTYYLNNMYISSSSNNDPNKAISNAVNSLNVDSSVSRVTYTTSSDNKITGTRPNNYIQVDKEHVWPKNHGFKQKDENNSDLLPKGAPTDLHNLVAADHNTNSVGHNDFYYGNVENKTESNTIYAYLADGSIEVSGWKDDNKRIFEPTDEWKGNVARCLMYMATRYSKDLKENSQVEPYLLLTNEENPWPNIGGEFDGYHPNLDTILLWHELDPVDEYERHRNNLIYFNVQNNRNPYIDFPYLARRAFSSDLDFSSLKDKYNIHLDNTITFNIYLPTDNNKFELKSVTYDESVIKLEDNNKKVIPVSVGSTDIIYIIHDKDENNDIEFKTTINIKDKLEYIGPSSINLKSFEKFSLDYEIKNMFDDEIIGFEGGLPSCIKEVENNYQVKLYGNGEIVLSVKSQYVGITPVATIKVQVRLSNTIIIIISIISSLILVTVIVLAIVYLKKKKKRQTK